MDRQHRQERQEGARDEHAEHVPEVRARGHLDVLDRVAERLPPFDYSFLKHHQALLEENDVGRLLGDIDRRIHGDTDIRLAQCAGVVDAVAHEADGVTAGAERADDPDLVIRRELREHDMCVGNLAERRIVEASDFAAEDDVADREPHVLADFARHQVIVAGEDLHDDAVVSERLDGRCRALFWRIEESHEASENEIAFVSHRVGTVPWIELAIGDGDYTEPIFIQLGHQFSRVAAAFVVELDDVLFVADACAYREHFLNGAFADQLVRRVLVIDHHRHPAAREIKRDLIHFAVRLVDREFGVDFAVLEHRDVEQILQPGLIKRIEIGEREDRFVLLANHIDMLLEDDLVLRQRAGLVRAQHVHRAEVLNRIQSLHDRLPLRHRRGAFGEVRRDDHRQHFRRQPDGDGEAEEERLEPVVLAEAVDQEDDRNHHENEADEQPAHLIHADVERRRHTLADQSLGHRAEARLASRGGDDSSCGAADDACAHKTDRRQFGQREWLIRGGCAVRLLDWKCFAGER